jgi:sarcosine oxidase subunit gamma
MAEVAIRRSALEGRDVRRSSVSIAPAPTASRLSLRAPAESVEPLSKALGLALPTRPKTSAEKNGRAALWLGPDEWLVIDQSGGDPAADCAGVGQFHSAVDISHRNVGIVVSGPGAEATISAGCPQDISPAAFPVGVCSRTVLHKVEIVLWRTRPDRFRVECWRSFSDYAFSFLAEASKDAAA